MFNFDPGYWLMALAAAVFCLTAIVVLVSTTIIDEETGLPMSTRSSQGPCGNARHDEATVHDSGIAAG